MIKFKDIMKSIIENQSGILRRIEKESEKLKKKYKITDTILAKAKKEVSKKVNVHVSKLQFAHIGDYGDGNIFISYHIIDPKHKRYKSTVNYVWLPIERRG